MQLRLAKETDASSLAAISIEVWLGTYLKHGVSPFFADYALDTFTTAKMAGLIADDREWVLVSENSEGIDGFIRLRAHGAGPVTGCSDMEIVTFYVQPRHHGRGIGKALLGAALDYCSAQSQPSPWLTTNAQNAPAIAFYLSQGFEKRGETEFRIEDQTYLNNVYVYRPS